MKPSEWAARSSDFVKPCPVNDRHGWLRVVRNQAGGLIAICPKCYVPAKGRENLLKEVQS